MLNSTEHGISILINLKCLKIKTFLAFRCSDVAFIMLINIKMPTIVGILTFMSMINFMLRLVEQDFFYNLGPGEFNAYEL